MSIEKQMRSILDRKLKEVNQKQMYDEIGKTTVDEMRTFISRGISPVRGERKFKQYKDKEKYPGIPNRGPNRYPQKSATPVNLNLSGEMLDQALGHRANNNSVRVGDVRDSGDVSIRFRVHNTGERSDIPRRKFVPYERGDRFLVSIEEKIRGVIEKHLQGLLSRK